MSPQQRTREYLHLFRSSPLTASGTAIAKWTPEAVEQIHHAELRGATLVIFRTASHARYPKACPRDIAAVLHVQDCRFDMVRVEREVRVYVTPRDGPAHFYIKPIRRAVEKWRLGVAKVLANPVPRISEFRVCGAVGTGGLGRVFVAEWRGMFSRVSGDFEDPLVCLKVLPKGSLFCEKLLERAAVEREILARLRGKRYIVQLSFAFQTRENLFLGTPLCPGGDLKALIRTYGMSQVVTRNGTCMCPYPSARRLDEYTARVVLAELVVAVGNMHSTGIVHGDLRLANILLGSDGNIVVGGFDMGRFIGEDVREDVDYGGGPHIAPEVGREKYGPAADVWAIGVAAFELLTGQRPFPKQPCVGGTCDSQKKLYSLCLPCWLTPSAKAMISALLKEDPTKRPTLEEIRGLEFFAKVDWTAVEEGKWDIPFPQASNMTSNSLNVEVTFKDSFMEPRDVAGHVIGFEYGVPGESVKPLHIIRRLHPPGLLNLFRSFSPEDRPLLKSLPTPVKDFLSIW